ncbi:MAG: hypothetical protein KUG73_00050 [Pseudomonadales bacterium]|nr:hypothetical protein [Pseudomonadales bacterium]
MYITPYVNRGLGESPTLEHHINLFSVAGLPSAFSAPRMKVFGMSLRDYHRIKSDGFSGVQSHLMLNPSVRKSANCGLTLSAAAIVKPEKLRTKATKWKRQGYCCATIMIGTGQESLPEAIALAELTLKVSEEIAIPIYLELHRGTVTQDISIVQGMIEACPGIRFNADFSHYITAYRWCETFTEDTLRYIEPILSRVCYVHLRPSNSEHIQISLPGMREFELLRCLLIETFRLFRKSATAGDVLVVAPELLPTITGYADLEKSRSGHVDKVNRYQQSLDLRSFAQACFDGGVVDSFTNGKNKQVSFDGDKCPLISINNIDDWSILRSEACKQAEYIRVMLGNSLRPVDDFEELITSYQSTQSNDGRLCLETMRNTITHNGERTITLQKRYPDIQLSLNVAEWVLGNEITVDQLSTQGKIVAELKNVVLINPRFSTAEHRYDGRRRYNITALLSISVLMELIYTRFYVKLWGKISAPHLPLICVSHTGDNVIKTRKAR